MKRVDFDPDGDRHYENRGVSGYERISWEEALDIVSKEMIRIRKQYGPGAIFFTWVPTITGEISDIIFPAQSVSSTLSAQRCVCITRTAGKAGHGAASTILAALHITADAEPYSTVEDCLQNSEFIVFWSSDPESTAGNYAGQEGTIRREWIKKLGIMVVHIDPYQNATAAFVRGRWIAPRPATDAALVLRLQTFG